MSGTLRHWRDVQSSDGVAMTDPDDGGAVVPRSQIRPTGLSEQAVAASEPSVMTTIDKRAEAENVG